MRKLLLSVLLVLLVAGIVVANGYYEQLFKVKMVKSSVTYSRVIATSMAEKVALLTNTSGVGRVIIAAAWLDTPTSTASYSNVDTVGYAAGASVYSLDPRTVHEGVYGVKFRFTCDSVAVATSTLEAFVSVKND